MKTLIISDPHFNHNIDFIDFLHYIIYIGGAIMSKTIKCYCVICNKFIGEFYYKHARKTCSKEHRSILTSRNSSGSNNANYGKTWSKKQKELSSIRSKKWHEEHKEDFLQVNKSRQFGTRQVPSRSKCTNCNKPNADGAKYCTKCKSLFYKSNMLGKKHSVKTKEIISKKSSAKFTDEFKKKQRALFEKKGYWVPLNKVKPYIIYNRLANWSKKMFDLLSTKELRLLKEKGVYSNNNTTGVVRDHKYPRYLGFIEGVHPIILRHPCNCQLLTHKDNITKGFKIRKGLSYKSILLDKLFSNIKKYKKVWHEQQLCVEAVKLYESGERVTIKKGIITKEVSL